MESRSKFACLNIDDDSDEEFTKVSANKLASKRSGSNGYVRIVSLWILLLLR